LEKKKKARKEVDSESVASPVFATRKEPTSKKGNMIAKAIQILSR